MMNKVLLFALALFVALTLIGCGSTLKNYEPKTSDEESIKNLLIKWKSTWNAHDVNSHIALWNDKAQIMYGKDRKIATKDEYAEILPNRMKDHPNIKLGFPKIMVSGHKADVKTNMNIGSFQQRVTFHLVKEKGNWSFMSWEY